MRGFRHRGLKPGDVVQIEGQSVRYVIVGFSGFHKTALWRGVVLNGYSFYETISGNWNLVKVGSYDRKSTRRIIAMVNYEIKKGEQTNDE